MKINILMMIFILGIAFTCGLIVGTKKVFPYNQLKCLKALQFSKALRGDSCSKFEPEVLFLNYGQVIKY